MRNEYVNLKVSDGTEMKTYVVRPEGTPAGAMLVFQEIFGVNHHIRDVADRFAREGYLTVAPDLFHRFAPGYESGYSGPEIQTGIGYLGAMRDPGLAEDIRAAYGWVQSQGPLPTAAIGYCLGGRCAFMAAISVPLACAISYYGGGIAPNPFGMPALMERASELKAPILMIWGGQDAHIPPDSVKLISDAVRAAGKQMTSVEFSWAKHGFFCDVREDYDATASALAWPLTLQYLKANLGGQAQTATR